MFEDYLEDASYFFDRANDPSSDEKIARRYYRVSILCAANAAEAFVNYVADTLSKGAPLEVHEIAFLRDKKFAFELNKQALLIERTEYHPLEDKLGLLIKKFIKNFDFKSDMDWKNINEFKKLRNDLAHPRNVDDVTSLIDYKQLIKRSLASIITIMDKLYQAMHRSSLRRKLLDLIPD